jgi:hypothetical protein
LPGATSIRRPSTSAATTRPNGHVRGPSIPALSRTGPSSTFRQSLSKPGAPLPPRSGGMAQSSSIMHLRNLRGKMQRLEERVQTARSKLPAPVNTPPRVSPRSGSSLGNHIPSSVTVRSRKRTGGSTISGADSLPDKQPPATPSIPRSKPSRLSLSQQNQPLSPTRGDMAAPSGLRPLSRASGISGRSSFAPSHSRPGSRASVSGFRAPLGNGAGLNHAPNASTDRVRPQSSLSSYGYDGALDEEDGGENARMDFKDVATPTPRRTTFAKRTSDVGSAIPSPTKRTSFGNLQGPIAPSLSRRQSATGFTRVASGSVAGGDMRPPSRQLDHVKEGYDVNETF